MRIRGLDFLRGIAIIGVLFRHSDMSNVIVMAGGYGVDLFFVLSGFLVAGLLFKEYQARGNSNIGRFLIRRGFKIYPAFYICLIATVLLDAYYFCRPQPTSSIISEAFFIQNYRTGVRFHTWSLGVEEQFYFFLAFFVLAAIKFKWIENVKAMLFTISTFTLIIFCLRLNFSFKHLHNPVPIFASHLKADGLFMGVLLAYIWNFKPELITKWQQNKISLFVLATLLIVPAFVLLPESFFMETIGFNLMHFGFALLIILVCDKSNEAFVLKNPYLKYIPLAVCFIGVNSYSIYLWHLLVKDVLYETMKTPNVNSVLFFTSAIVMGVLSALIIENQFMKIADRYFPRPTSLKVSSTSNNAE